MLAGSQSRPHIEKIYLANGKDIEKTIDLFLSGNVPEEEKEELHILIE